MEKIDKLIKLLTDELCETKDEISIDIAMKYCDMIKDLSDANYHVTVTDAMEEHGAEETVEKHNEYNLKTNKDKLMEFKESHPTETNRMYTEAFMNDMISEFKEVWNHLTVDERNISKAKLSSLINSI